MQKPPHPAHEVPVLETQRFRLRAYRKEDFAKIADIWADPTVQRHTTGRAFSQEELWARTLRNAGLWPLLGYGYWAVEEKVTGEFVGEAGFADFMRDLQPSIAGVPEAGWIVASRFHGKGYATEVVRAALAWRDEHLAGQRTVCVIHQDNAASIRVAEKCGFREYARAQYRDHHVIVFERRAQSQEPQGTGPKA